ncbi:MAG: AraC family transcriptional regulator [Victivallaceae bacterium]|nr:AraC family transcriptional regulator [Victivallaceae bacterium]
MKHIDINMNNIDFIKISKAQPQYRAQSIIYPHRHHEMEMHFITQGHGAMEVNGELFPLTENSFIITFPEDIHRLITAKDCSFMLQYIIFFDIVDNSAEFNDVLRNHFQCGTKNSNGSIVFPEVERLWNSGNKLLMAAAEYRLTAFILTALGAGNIAITNPYVEKAQNYMRNHVSNKLSLHELSRYVGLEKSYFCRLFKQVSGETPMRFFMQQKIELSKELLATGQRNSDIASAIDFADEFHFSRCFKSITGISPRRYRQSASIA